MMWFACGVVVGVVVSVIAARWWAYATSPELSNCTSKEEMKCT